MHGCLMWGTRIHLKTCLPIIHREQTVPTLPTKPRMQCYQGGRCALWAERGAFGGLVESRAACAELFINSVFRWLEKRVVRGLHGDMPGHRCPGVPGGNIATKTLVNQCFHGKSVLWAAKALPTLRGLWLAVSPRKKQAFQPQPHLCLTE